MKSSMLTQRLIIRVILRQPTFLKWRHTHTHTHWLTAIITCNNYGLALWNRADHYIFILWFLSSAAAIITGFQTCWKIYIRQKCCSQWQRLVQCLPYFDILCGLSANLECRSETCCARLAVNAGRKKSSKSRHLGTIPQLCWAISLQLRHVSTIRKNLLGSNISSTCPHNMVNFGPLAVVSLGHPCKFQRVSRLGSVTARHSSSGRQPNFAALNRGRHLYSAGRPSCWALATF